MSNANQGKVRYCPQAGRRVIHWVGRVVSLVLVSHFHTLTVSSGAPVVDTVGRRGEVERSSLARRARAWGRSLHVPRSRSRRRRQAEDAGNPSVVAAQQQTSGTPTARHERVRPRVLHGVASTHSRVNAAHAHSQRSVTPHFLLQDSSTACDCKQLCGML